MLFMVIERFKNRDAVYRRLRDKGRSMPEGLRYVNSWVEASLDRCFPAVSHASSAGPCDCGHFELLCGHKEESAWRPWGSEN
jgi:hypothetical protein